MWFSIFIRVKIWLNILNFNIPTISLVQIVQYLRAELMLHKCLDLTVGFKKKTENEIWPNGNWKINLSVYVNLCLFDSSISDT
jgi:hypothetical protein